MSADKVARNLNKEVPAVLHGPQQVDRMSDESVHERMKLILGENSLSGQEKRFILYRCSGMSTHAAAKASGYRGDYGYELEARSPIQAAIDKYQHSQAEAVNFTRETAHQLYMDAYSVSGNATEMKNVVDSLVKLHGVGSDTGSGGAGTQVNIQINNMENLTDEELLKVVGRSDDYLDPESDIEQ